MTIVADTKKSKSAKMTQLRDALLKIDTAMRWVRDGKKEEDIDLTARNIRRHFVVAITQVALRDALNAVNPKRDEEGDLVALRKGLTLLGKTTVS